MRRIDLEFPFKMPTTSHAVVAGGLVFVAGVFGTVEPAGHLAEGGVGPETAQAIRHVESILRAAGASLDDLVMVRVHLKDVNDFWEMDRSYGELIDSRPARIAVYASELPMRASIEVEAIAALPEVVA